MLLPDSHIHFSLTHNPSWAPTATHGHFNNVTQTESHIMQLTSLNWLFGWHSYLEIHPGECMFINGLLLLTTE